MNEKLDVSATELAREPREADAGEQLSDPWRAPVRGDYPAAATRARSGWQQVQALLDGTAPQPPISRLTGMRLSSAEAGAAVFEMPLTPWLYAPQGAIPLGPLAMPADAAMACAIQTVLPPATPFSTSELTLRLLAPAKSGSTLTARARLVQMRETIGLAEASLSDGGGRLLAHGSTLCMTTATGAIEEPEDSARSGRAQSARDEVPPAGDPWERPALGEIVPQSVWEQMSGLEVMRAQLDGSLAPPPLHHYVGLTLSDASEHEVAFGLPTSEWLCAPAPGRVQGGAIALLAEAALTGAIQTTVPAGTAVAPVDLKINYLRPLTADGRPATSVGKVLHRGRRMAVASSQVIDADGKPVALATGSAMVLAGSDASLGAVEP